MKRVLTILLLFFISLTSLACSKTKENNTNQTEQKENSMMYFYIDDYKLEVTLENNKAVKALIELLEVEDITYSADDYGNFEKVGTFGHTLPREDAQTSSKAGDVILYLGNRIVILYDNNSWSYTKLGSIKGYTQTQLKEILQAGEGPIQIRISLK